MDVKLQNIRQIQAIVARNTLVKLQSHQLSNAELCNDKTRMSLYTSMPSRVIIVLSIFKIAALITSGLGKAVSPMLIALDRL